MKTKNLFLSLLFLIALSFVSKAQVENEKNQFIFSNKQIVPYNQLTQNSLISLPENDFEKN